MTLEAVEASLGGSPAAPFLLRRAESEVHHLPAPELARVLSSVLTALFQDDRSLLSQALLHLTGWAESRSRMEEATAAVALAAHILPGTPEIDLHLGRIARKSGDVRAARSAYARVANHAPQGSPLRQLAAVGEALLASDPVQALGCTARAALRQGDPESAAVALEERATKRQEGGDLPGAVRDFLTAAGRFPDPIDRGRAVHRAADLLLARSDVASAHDVLRTAETVGRPEQGRHARARLHQVAWLTGDEVGRRRWRDAGTEGEALCCLLPSRKRTSAPCLSRSSLARWVRMMESAHLGH